MNAEIPLFLSPADLLALLTAACPPVAPRDYPLAGALGRVAADLPGPAAGSPAQPCAAVPGYAVVAGDLAGAGVMTPLVLMQPPVWLAPGDALPPGTDAVIEAAMVETTGPLTRISAEVLPGGGVLPAGADLAPSAPLLQAGQVIRPADLLRLRICGASLAPCRVARVQIQGAGPWAAYLADVVTARGADLVSEDADLLLSLGPGSLQGGEVICQGLVLNGLQPVQAALQGPLPVLHLAPQPGTVVLFALSVLVPLLDHLTARVPERAKTLPLARKLSSPPGVSDLVLLAEVAGQWLPLPSEIPGLAALAGAEAFVLIAPQDEGCPAGSALTAMPLHRSH